jgi:hypothetical protein
MGEFPGPVHSIAQFHPHYLGRFPGEAVGEPTDPAAYVEQELSPEKTLLHTQPPEKIFLFGLWRMAIDFLACIDHPPFSVKGGLHPSMPLQRTKEFLVSSWFPFLLFSQGPQNPPGYGEFMAARASSRTLQDFFPVTTGAIFHGDSRRPSFFPPQASALAGDGWWLKRRSVLLLQDAKGKTIPADRAGQKIEKPSFQEFSPSLFFDLTAFPIL